MYLDVAIITGLWQSHAFHLALSIVLHIFGICTGLWIWYIFPQNVSDTFLIFYKIALGKYCEASLSKKIEMRETEQKRYKKYATIIAAIIQCYNNKIAQFPIRSAHV